eukprot:12419388-Karenia_brevis.AAC.1
MIGLSMKQTQHRRKIVEYFRFDWSTKPGGVHGYKEDKIDEENEELLGKSGAKEYRGSAARGNFMSLDCPDMQFLIKQ